MPGTCSIITYHYVRELSETRYPRICGLTETNFRGQLDYLARHYRFVTLDEVLDACHGSRELPPNAAVLTFDDGYLDHYTNVFPLLDRMGIQGWFFPPVCAVDERRVLDVNKIHFVLASVESTRELLDSVFARLDRLRVDGHEIESNEALFERLAVAGRFDGPELVFVKRLLQRELPERPRAAVVDDLFRHFVTDDETAFARELYVSRDQLLTMRRHGMVIGGHGYSHRWLDTLPEDQQAFEIESSVAFLESLGVSMERWVMCYPYGAHNESLRRICAGAGCGLGVTTETAIARMETSQALEMPRLDTNHLPTDASATPSPWTIEIQKQPA